MNQITDRTRSVGILLFDDVEVLDFAGPFEVFSVTGRRHEATPFTAFTVSEFRAAITARGGLNVLPAHDLACPPIDILVIPGGFGTRREMHNVQLQSWIRERASVAEIVLSVCSGALMLATAGLLDGLTVTTHRGALELLAQTAPSAHVSPGEKFCDNGHIVTSAGISAGIEASLHIVERLLGRDWATETAHYMEYDWKPGRATAAHV